MRAKLSKMTITTLGRAVFSTGSVGPAGAIWVQGGEIDMQDGAVIENVVGRAIYADGGTATINGTISNITIGFLYVLKSNNNTTNIKINVNGILAAKASLDST